MEIKDEDFDAVLREKLNSANDSNAAPLPYAGDLWKDIDRALLAKQKTRNLHYALSMAATVCLLLIPCIWWLYTERNDTSTLVYRIETIQKVPEPVSNETDMAEKQALNFIEIQCKARQTPCRSMEFIALKAELDQLQTEVQKINKQRQLYGPSPALIKAEIRLENHKMYLIRELIETLKS